MGCFGAGDMLGGASAEATTAAAELTEAAPFIKDRSVAVGVWVAELYDVVPVVATGTPVTEN